ncbi:transposase [Burkholderia sp. SRS-W-2-2016]|uniref:transposase n=1 Tax=Burkholderia sp. SRS-W-2-2016 TaxID=1926878 RepID=UPI0015BBB0C0|nr:transposase [Burkholderia sp. SRS-W-2-2016]
MSFIELSDDEWACVVTLFKDAPAVRFGQRGRPRANLRIVVEAVLWVLTTGETWSRLPRRFPSAPTCRRRFAEWQEDGTLAQMVQMLSLTGRQFAFVPAGPVSAQRHAGESKVAVAFARQTTDTVSFAHWMRPESWQKPCAEARHSRLAGPIADMARQLLDSRDKSENVRRSDSFELSDTLRQASPSAGSRQYEPQTEHSQPASGSWRIDRPSGGVLFADDRGYVISASAQPGRNDMFRAAAEIIKDGKRRERSGLVGPPFRTPHDATHYAFEWAKKWIDRQLTLEGDSHTA